MANISPTSAPHKLVKKPTPRYIKLQNASAGLYLQESPQEYNFQGKAPESRFVITEHFSLTPNSLAIYNRFHSRNNSVTEVTELAVLDSKQDSARVENVKVVTPRNAVAHNFELSKQARKNLRNKVTWLYHFAKKQTLTTQKGKQITNFKMNFFTLKLPSVQVDSSDFITKNCLNQLLTEISKKYSFKNYVWRLEYQKNGNLHYHVATDTYIDYHFLLKTWNRILNKYGYVDVYTRKYSSYSLADYVRENPVTIHNDYKQLQVRYAKGCREGWKNPNSVDVKAVFGKSNIAFYISKYMAKKPEEGQQVVLPVCENNSANSRLWFCSRSLSKCKSVSDFREVEEIDLYSVLRYVDGVRVVICDYCILLYFQIDLLPLNVRRLVVHRLERYRREVQYDAVA